MKLIAALDRSVNLIGLTVILAGAALALCHQGELAREMVIGGASLIGGHGLKQIAQNDKQGATE